MAVEKFVHSFGLDYLCYDIEPNLQGASVIAVLFKEAAHKAKLI